MSNGVHQKLANGMQSIENCLLEQFWRLRGLVDTLLDSPTYLHTH